MASVPKREGLSDRELETESEVAEQTGLLTPQNWRMIGLLVLAAVIVILLAGQMLGGNKGTDVIPGTPVAAPQNTAPLPHS